MTYQSVFSTDRSRNLFKPIACLIGSASLIAFSGAQAADLPVKAKAVEYMRICSLYGAGFYYIPGTDTCIKLSSYQRVDVLANSNFDDTGNYSAQSGAKNRFTNAFTWRSRADPSIDTRTATEYGVVRTFTDLAFTWTDDSYTGNLTTGAGTVYSALGGSSAVAPGGNANNGNLGLVAAGSLGVYYAFIQFAGFTMGKAVSPFSAPWQNYPGNNFDGLVGGGGTVTGVNQFVYTADLGGGVSVTFGAQDPTQYYQAGVLNFSPTATTGSGLFGSTGSNDYGGNTFPDVIATLKVDQAWGLFQASVAAHDNNPAYYNNNQSNTIGLLPGQIGGGPEDKWGYAGQLALRIKNIPTGAGDVINVQGVYTDGATRYNIQDLATQAGAAAIFGHSSIPGVFQSVGFGVAPDTVFNLHGSQQLIQTWGGRGAFNHNWDPYWSSALYGAYAHVNFGGGSAFDLTSARGIYCHGFVAATGLSTGLAGCNPDYNIAQLGTITRWTPVKNLTFSADATFTHLQQDMAAGSLIVFGSSAIAKPLAVYQIKNENTGILLLRAQRNW
ncbi:MAG: porin [Bradyrhizobium sp.]|uniref:porin n=1 Tax=Bradyrhizobium sp. TaxID=376 RepID=UPI00120FEF5A|nr:porin [Bradyrhizobium sp.]THD58995.1 MAG: porin [Bradyrhizobium sp.]